MFWTKCWYLETTNMSKITQYCLFKENNRKAFLYMVFKFMISYVYLILYKSDFLLYYKRWLPVNTYKNGILPNFRLYYSIGDNQWLPSIPSIEIQRPTTVSAEREYWKSKYNIDETKPSLSQKHSRLWSWIFPAPCSSRNRRLQHALETKDLHRKGCPFSKVRQV